MMIWVVPDPRASVHMTRDTQRIDTKMQRACKGSNQSDTDTNPRNDKVTRSSKAENTPPNEYPWSLWRECSSAYMLTFGLRNCERINFLLL